MKRKPLQCLSLHDSTTPAQTNGTTDTEFTMKATIGVGSSDNEAMMAIPMTILTFLQVLVVQFLLVLLRCLFGPGDASASISIAIDDDELYEGGATGTQKILSLN